MFWVPGRSMCRISGVDQLQAVHQAFRDISPTKGSDTSVTRTGGVVKAQGKLLGSSEDIGVPYNFSKTWGTRACTTAWGKTWTSGGNLKYRLTQGPLACPGCDLACHLTVPYGQPQTYFRLQFGPWSHPLLLHGGPQNAQGCLPVSPWGSVCRRVTGGRRGVVRRGRNTSFCQMHCQG